MILNGDSLQRLKEFPDNYFHSVVTDPPYGLSFMGKKWDYNVPSVALWKEVLRVLKPGGHLLSFGGTRTYHRMVLNIEDAGFEIRDQIQWIYGSGFPKSHDISKAIDREAGAKREVIEERLKNGNMKGKGYKSEQAGQKSVCNITAPTTAAAKQWQGWGSALKPANEPIVMARKPIEGTLAQNTLKHGCGGINVDAGRIGFSSTEDSDKVLGPTLTTQKGAKHTAGAMTGGIHRIDAGNPQGRFPANIIFDEEAAAVLGEPSRFFYVAKASKRERNAGLDGELKQKQGARPKSADASGKFPDHDHRVSGGNNHPTVKPIKLMEYLIKLVTPPAGIVLDPFCGSGSTGVAAKNLGLGFVGIEREKEYCEIAEKRLA